MSAFKTVDVVIVTYGSSALVRRCLSSLSSADIRPHVNVTVVDNNSPDDTCSVVRDFSPAVRLLERSDNKGFAFATNLGLEDASSEYVLVLNPDTEITAETLQHLVGRLDAEPGIGVIGCRLVLTDGSFDHASKRFIPTPGAAALYFVSKVFGRKLGRYVASNLGEHETGDVDAVNGAFMLIRRSALNEVGPLDERYWMYGEDLDWCIRFKQKGWRIVYDGTVSAVHIKGGSSGRRRSLKLNYHFHKSMAIFYRQHMAKDSLALGNALVYLAILSRFLGVQLLGVFSRLLGER